MSTEVIIKSIFRLDVAARSDSWNGDYAEGKLTRTLSEQINYLCIKYFCLELNGEVESLVLSWRFHHSKIFA
jgi:hypothetical protein